MTPLVQAREQVLQAALDVLALERHIADEDTAMGRLVEAEHALDRAATELAEVLETAGQRG